MSAIFGIIYKDGKPVDKQLMDAMKQSIAHRATDGSGAWQSQNAALGHCKLLVYPQQHYEDQPFETGNLIITADARLDNRGELASKLDIDKQQLPQISDDRLLLQTYRKWGKQCINYLEGEYAFAIWDTQSQTLFAATDHIGFRPFFYYDSPGVFIFCSEIKGVVAAKTTPNYFEEESLIEYYFKQGTPNKTYNKEVFALCGGNTLILKEGKMAIQKYWKLQPTGKYHFTNDQDWYDCTRDLLYRAVEKRLNPDVPVGITLSGGLDSTSIACILSELLMKKNKPLYAFSSVLPLDHRGIEKDERQYIEIVGKHCPNIVQTYVEAPGVGPLSNLEEAFEIEEVFPNPFFYMDRALLEAAKERNVRNLFSGFGGDFWVSWKGNTVIYLLMKQGKFREAFDLIRQFSKAEQTSVLHEFRVKYLAYTKGYKTLRSLKTEKEINWQVYTTLRDDFVKKYQKQLQFEPDPDNTRHMQKMINSGSMGNVAARFYNRNNRYEMDSALPLFDKNVLEFLVEVPAKLFIKGGYPRNLMRSAMKESIPTEIIHRKGKLPYAPGYHYRIAKEKSLFEKMNESLDYELIFEKYTNRSRITNHFDEIEPQEGFTQATKIVGIRMAQAGCTNLTLKFLLRKGYIV